jgi:predicted NBD/HSP70 family sugar kinase
LGVGVGAPEPLDPVRGVVRNAPTLDGWAGVPFAAQMGAKIARQVRLENDANAAALGTDTGPAGAAGIVLAGERARHVDATGWYDNLTA